jgi:Tn3 transposase DDE domain
VRFSWLMLGREPQFREGTADGVCRHLGARHFDVGGRDGAHDAAALRHQRPASHALGRLRTTPRRRRRRSTRFMRQHPIAVTWGRSGLASSDMMSLETRQRVWQARLDPRRQTSSLGVYGHVLAGWGIFHAQPLRAQRTASRPRTEAKSSLEHAAPSARPQSGSNPRSSARSTAVYGYVHLGLASPLILGLVYVLAFTND